LIDLVRAGNDRAFEAIVHRYRRQLLRYCGRLLTGPRAEDAVQQTFLNAYRAMKADERHIDLRPWLYRIAHNVSLNVLRSAAPAGEEPIGEQIDGVERPDQAVERRQTLAEVVAAVQALPPRQRDAIVLHELEGRSYDQIAAELDVSGGAVRQLLSRARATLRAGATAVVPEWVLARLASASSSGEPVAARVAELVTAGGGAAALAKFGTAVVVAGAVAVGAADGPLGISDDAGHGGKGDSGQAAIVAAGAGGGSGGVGTGGDVREGATLTRGDSQHGRSAGRHRGGRENARREGRRRGRGRGGDSHDEGFLDVRDDGRHSGGGSESGSGGGDGDRSGSSGGDDRSGSGSGDGDRSGSGEGSFVADEPDSTNSGPSGSSDDGTSHGGGSNSGPGGGSDDGTLTVPLPDSPDSSGPGSGSDDGR